MLDPHRLRMLHHFAVRGSIAATAEALGYSASAVSQQLAALEREAGVSLLERSARSAELTDLGRRLAGHAVTVLDALEAAEADLAAHAEVPSGRVVIATPPSAAVLLAPALADVRAQHPRVGLIVHQAGPAEALRRLRAREVDVAVVDTWGGGPPPRREALATTRLLRDPLVLAVPADHELATVHDPLDLAATAEQPWICAPSGEPSRAAFDRLLGELGVEPTMRWEFEGLATIATLVGHGVGIAVVPRLAVPPHLHGRVVLRELPGERARHLDAVTREASTGRPATEVTLAAMATAVGARASGPRGEVR